MNRPTIHGILCLALFSAAFQNQALAKESEFTASEIKQIRFLSRSLIKSRANEKLRIEKEIQPEKARVQAMRDTLGDLEASYQHGMSVSENGSDKQSASNVIESITDGDGAKVRVKKSTDRIARVKPVNAGKNNSLVKKRNTDLNKAMSAVAAERIKAEGNLTSKFMFWKSKSKKDKRNEHVISVANSVEGELQAMQKNNKLDIGRVKALKEKLKIKKQEIAFEDIDPTFHIKTKHRK